MLRIFRALPSWLPATLMMIAIFIFSSIPSSTMPHFNWADTLVKKGAHMLGYGLLAFAYFYAFKFAPSKLKFALLLALLYAMTDEFHQSFVPGRHASWLDVAIDSAGAIITLIWAKKTLDFRPQTSDS